MNRLIKFEDTTIDIQIIDGTPMFELYAVGMALGQIKKNSAGTLYPAKDRIDKNVKSAEIQPVVRNGQLYITESQIYDLMLETKTDKCRAFRKWLTNEVLPELNRTGSYRIQANPMYHPEITDYKYQTKLYDGETVLNTADISYFLDLAPDQIKKIRDAMMTEGIHYFKLSGEELKKFKVKHRLVRSTAKSMYLYNYEGYHLLEIYFAEYSLHPTRKKKPQPQFVVLDRERPTMPPEDMKQVVPNIKTKVLMNNVKEHCMAANGLAQTLLSVYTRGELKVIRKALVNEIFALETMAKQIEGIKF